MSELAARFAFVGVVIGWWNPFEDLAKDTVGKSITEGWKAFMLSIWDAGLQFMEILFIFMDSSSAPTCHPVAQPVRCTR